MEEARSYVSILFSGDSEWFVPLVLTIFVVIAVIFIVHAGRGRGSQIIGGRGSASSFWWFATNDTSGDDFEGGGASGSW